jgi:hypothetical protein
MMIFSRVLFFVMAVCIALAAWNVHVYPTATYRTSANGAIAHSTCPSVWDLWINHVPPAPVPLPKNISNAVGPTRPELKALACGASLVGKEHIAETWAAGALVAFISGAFVWWRFEE